MHPFAQTIVCLYNQLRKNNYTSREIDLVYKAYRVSKLLFTGRFQPSGKEFISHCVGTASILASVYLPAELVAAGLIHNVYQNGDFGNGKEFISKSKRKYIRENLNSEVEEYVAQFAIRRWNSTTIININNRIKDLSLLEQKVVLLRLADALEHLLDLEVLYYDHMGWARYITNAKIFEKMAENLGYPVLAERFKEYYSEINSIQPPVKIFNGHDASYVVVSQSFKKRLKVIILERIRYLILKIKLKRMSNIKRGTSLEQNKINNPGVF
jgi:(p)ppGpp synthase/HD superfamily hydrolase